MKIEQIALDKIKPYEANAKTHTSRQVEAVAQSISRFGAVQPIVVDKNYVIIIGHCRYKAALLLGMETFPTVVASELSAAQVKALRIADNRTNESPWDENALKDEISGLLEDFEMLDLGFSEADLLELTRDITADKLEVSDADMYVENANKQLPATSIVITYKTQEAHRWLLEKLGVKELGVVAYIGKIMNETAD